VDINVTDSNGVSASASLTVTVRDTTPPEISIPANITVGNDAGQCSAMVNPGTATATDNCLIQTLTGTRSDGKSLVDSYPVGTTTITWIAMDGVGLTAVGSQTVTVNDTEFPVLNVPANMTVYQDSASGATVTFSVTASDNCGSPTIICTPPSGSIFPLGTTTVNCTATDPSGNTATGSFTVTVVPPPSTAGARVTGGGSINVSGGQATFGMVEITRYNGEVTGNLTYQDHLTGAMIRSLRFTALVVTGSHARVFGKASINGSGEFDFVVDVDDLGEPGGGVDQFRIDLSTGYTAGGTVLSGGNIQIHH
jgi:hypothetical protein